MNSPFLQVIDGFDAHFVELQANPPRMAAVNMRNIVGEFSFSFPGSLFQKKSSSVLTKQRKPRSSSSPKQLEKDFSSFD